MTETDLCNDALINIGIKTIAGLDEASNEARVCARLYPKSRDALLRLYNWNFAKKYDALALISGATVYRFDYAYAYPADCLAARSIFRTLPTDDPIIFERVGAQIWTDQADAVLVYTQKIETVNQFDGIFVLALGHFLAARMAPALVKDAKQRDAAIRSQIYYTGQAMQCDASEGFDNVVPSSADIFNAARA